MLNEHTFTKSTWRFILPRLLCTYFNIVHIRDYSVSFTNKLPLKLLLFIHITFYNHAANTSKSFCWMDGTMDRWLAWQRGSWCLYVVCGSPNKHYLRRRLIPLYISILIKWGRHTTTSLWVYWWTTTASGWVDGWMAAPQQGKLYIKRCNRRTKVIIISRSVRPVESAVRHSIQCPR